MVITAKNGKYYEIDAGNGDSYIARTLKVGKKTIDMEMPGLKVLPDEQIASVRQAIANRDDARSAFERAQQLNSRGLLSQVDRDTADTRLKSNDHAMRALPGSAGSSTRPTFVEST